MVSSTSPDNISGWENGDPASLVQMSQTMATSIQNALNKRERYSYVWADTAARTAETGMVTGSMGYQVDTEADYIYTGSAWRIYNLMMQPFTPSYVQGVTVGNGTSLGFLTIAAGWATVYYSFTLGSTSSIGTDPHIHAPSLAPVSSTLIGVGSIKVGWANFEDASAGAGGRFEGTALLSGNVNGTPTPNGAFRWGAIDDNNIYDGFEPLSSTAPFTWTTGDKAHMAVNYPVQE